MKKEFIPDCNSVVCASVFPWDKQGTWTCIEVNDVIVPCPHAESKKICAQALSFNKGNDYSASSKTWWSEMAFFFPLEECRDHGCCLVHCPDLRYGTSRFFHFFFCTISANVNTLAEENKYFSVIMNIALTLQIPYQGIHSLILRRSPI